jgi:hypothetical protein
MRALISFALLLSLSTLPTAAYAMQGHGGHGVRVHVGHHHHMNRFHTMHRSRLLGDGFIGDGFGDGYYGSDGVPYAGGAAPQPVVVPPAPPPLPRRVGDDRPTVEHTDVGVTIIRGPHLGP